MARVPDRGGSEPQSPAGSYPSSVAGRKADEAVEKDLKSQLRVDCDSLVSALSALLLVAERARSTAEERAGDRRRHEDALLAGTSEALEESLRKELLSLAGRANRSRQVLAPGVASLGWRDSEWYETNRDPGPGWAAAVRIGSLALPEGDLGVPLLLPLLNSGNLDIWQEVDAGAEADSLLRQVVLRHLAAVVPGQLRIAVFDPNLRGPLSAFSVLRKASIELFDPPMSSAEAFESYLADLADHVVRVSEMLAGRYSTLGELQSQSGQPLEAYRLLVVLDYPSSLSQRAHELLSRVSKQGPRCGVSTIILRDRSAKPATDFVVDSSLASSVRLSRNGSGWRCSLAPSLELRLDEEPPTELVEMVAAGVVERAVSGAAPSVPLEAILPAQKDWWSSSSGPGIQVMLGKSGLESAGFLLGDDVRQLHNVLVGGAVGQGKSNLLLVAIHYMATKYSPQDVEFYLLDFKEGLEFATLGAGEGSGYGLPHVRVLGLESDREFGLAVLDHLVEEFDRRAELFKQVGARNIQQLRERMPESSLPRLVVIIDEFQHLLSGDDEIPEKAVARLEMLSRKGRAYGIHLVLASQTLSGIQSLLTKQESIFSQFPVRIALKTNESESQTLLSTGNTEAARLRYRGEAVLNCDFGSVAGNTRLVVARADDGALDQVRQVLWNKADNPRQPVVFTGGRLASLTAAPQFDSLALGAAAHASVRRLWLGLPVAVTSEPVSLRFEPEAGRHLAIIGDGLDEAIGMLHAGLVTLALQHPPGTAEFLMVDMLSPSQSPTAQVPALVGALESLGQSATAYGPRQLPDALARLKATMEANALAEPEKTTYFVGMGMHRAVGIEEFSLAAGGTPVDIIRDAIKKGPVLGVHFIGWWNGYRAYQQQIEGDYSLVGVIECFCLLRMSRDDATSIIGPFVPWTPRDKRALVWDKTESERGSIAIPFAPLDEHELGSLGEGRRP